MPNVATSMHLFDAIIKPILLYGCEIWSPLNFRDLKQNMPENFWGKLKMDFQVETRYERSDFHIERLHLIYCKYLLGIRKNAHNLAIYSELGRFPLYTEALRQSVKFYYHLQSTPISSLANKALLANQALNTNNADCWLKSLNRIMTQTDLREWYTDKSASKKVHLHLRERFKNYWYKRLQTDEAKTGQKGGNKLRNYRRFKTSFQQEAYLNCLSKQKYSQIAKLRIGCHALKIETDRFSSKSKYIDPEDRTCDLCDLGNKEDELHFLMECPYYKEERTQYTDKLKDCPSWGNLQNLEMEPMFIWLLTNENQVVLEHTSHFISECFEKRSSGIKLLGDKSTPKT